MTDQGPPRLPTKPRNTLPTIATPTASSRATTRGDSLQTADLPLPETVIVPPTPVSASPASSGPRNVNPSAPPHTLQPMPEEAVQYESPDENSDRDASPRVSLSKDDARPALPPHPVPHRVASTPVPRSESMAPQGKEKERDDSALLQSPPSFVPVGLPDSSPHLFSAQRTPSPSSPGPSRLRDRIMRQHKRQSSAHVVRETTLGLQHEDDDGARVINQYKIGNSLGSGAYASVVLGIDVGDGKEYAIKEFSKARLQKQALMERQAQMARERRNRRPVLRPGPRGPAATEPPQSAHTAALVSDEMLEKDPLALIRREVAVMKKLDHPNLTKLYEAISVPNADGLFLVLEYLPGGVLMKVEPGFEPTNEKPPFTEEEAREYFRQICLGLEYLHANGIAHRDIKPENILFTAERDMVKLADFGVSEMFQGDDTIKAAGGSPAFLSPESFTASIGEVHGKSVDIWALGVTLYCMLRGKLPFNVANPIELMWMVREKEPEIPNEWHRDLQNLIRGMLRKDPEQRFTMTEIRENSWVNAWGMQPILSVEDNLFYYGNVFEEPTEEEVDNALISLRSVFTVVRAVHKMRRAVGMRQMSVMHEGQTGLSPSDGNVSLTSGSMDSYTLPDALTGVQTPSEMSEDEGAAIVSSPERDDTPEPPAHDKQKAGGWARLRPLKTDLARGGGGKPGPAKTMPNPAPRDFADKPEELASSPVDVHDSPNLVAESPVLMASSPVEHDSPVMLADSPIMAASPVEHDSPVMLADSPIMAASPVENDSPVMLADSPTMADSPVMADSPDLADSPLILAESPELAATPPVGITASQMTPVSRKIIPAMEPLSLDATPTQRTRSDNTDGTVSPQQL
ncbi:Pkinase-domain-containing protein [Cutaneotrichosporon oleaginosum]|uniref:Pkinase-domain-containing protein n=1 Tax=Cutaneotrichosporon oleaginosum TaxID=879819 RepID=A0A0J1AVP7_9TREE|nr:Pkinase-domain-containing protein [Cutaneotrichosporon oleaginosum]KLT39359.1 Pkinase-domain-containing protein [Cutaneotrichosporon oleaginosum]